MEWVPHGMSFLGRSRHIAGGAGAIDSQSQNIGRALGRSNLSPFVLQIKKLRSRDLRTLIKAYKAPWVHVLADWAKGSLQRVLSIS